MKNRLIGLAIVLAGLASLLLIGLAIPADAQGDTGRPRVTPSLMPYPDPSRGGVGTWHP